MIIRYLAKSRYKIFVIKSGGDKESCMRATFWIYTRITGPDKE